MVKLSRTVRVNDRHRFVVDVDDTDEGILCFINEMNYWIVKANRIDEALLQARELSFDWHSRAVLSLVGYQVVSRAIGVMKIPFSGR